MGRVTGQQVGPLARVRGGHRGGQPAQRGLGLERVLDRVVAAVLGEDGRDHEQEQEREQAERRAGAGQAPPARAAARGGPGRGPARGRAGARFCRPGVGREVASNSVESICRPALIPC